MAAFFVSRWYIDKRGETIFGTTLKKKITGKLCAEWVDNLIQGGGKIQSRDRRSEYTRVRPAKMRRKNFMKCVKKLVAVLLTAVMALTLLTACGGGGGGWSGTSNADVGRRLTSKINSKLSDTGISLTYSDTLTNQIITFGQLLQAGVDESTAMVRAGINGNDYEVVTVEINKDGSMEDAAGPLAIQIAALKNSWGTAKQIGYASAESIRNTRFIFALVRK